VALSLVNDDLVVGTVASYSSGVLALTGSSNIGALLGSDEPYYIEVYSGDLKGDRFDVDTAATKTSSNSTITLNATSPGNTLNVAGIGTLLNGAQVRLRKHVTLAQVQQMFQGQLVGNNNPALADQIQVYDPVADGYITYFLRADNTTWRRSGFTAPANSVVIFPGTGIFLTKVSSGGSLVQVGSVRNNDFVARFSSGRQLNAAPWPIDLSPNALGAVASNGWVGNNNPALADQIAVFNPSINGYDTYFLRADGLTWRKVGFTSPVSDVNIIPAGKSYFTTRVNGAESVLFINPLAL
jgi:hypothetical protein